MSYLENVASLVISRFSNEELIFLSTIHPNQSTINFKEEIIETFKAYYPSIYSFEELKGELALKIDDLKKQLTFSNKGIIKNLIFDFLSKYVFVDEETYKLNQTMFENISNPNISLNKKTVDKAIDELIYWIPEKYAESFNLVVQDKACSLQELLIARYSNSYFSVDLQALKNYVYTCPFWSNSTLNLLLTSTKHLTKLEKQMFFREIDPFFPLKPERTYLLITPNFLLSFYKSFYQINPNKRLLVCFIVSSIIICISLIIYFL